MECDDEPTIYATIGNKRHATDEVAPVSQNCNSVYIVHATSKLSILQQRVSMQTMQLTALTQCNRDPRTVTMLLGSIATISEQIATTGVTWHCNRKSLSLQLGRYCHLMVPMQPIVRLEMQRRSSNNAMTNTVAISCNMGKPFCNIGQQ